MLIMALLSLVCGVLAGRFAAKASSGLACNLRESIYEKVQTFAFSNIDKFSTAGLVTRMTTDVTNVQNAAQMLLRVAVRAPLMLVCSMVWTAGRHGCGVRRRGQAGPGGWVYPPSARWLSDGADWGWSEPVTRATAAAGYCPGCRGRPAGADFRRGHLLHRYPHGGLGAAGHGRPDDRPDHLCYSPPAVHCQKLRLHHGAGAGPYCGAWISQPAAGGTGQILSAVYRQRYWGIGSFHFRQDKRRCLQKVLIFMPAPVQIYLIRRWS